MRTPRLLALLLALIGCARSVPFDRGAAIQQRRVALVVQDRLTFAAAGQPPAADGESLRALTGGAMSRFELAERTRGAIGAALPAQPPFDAQVPPGEVDAALGVLLVSENEGRPVPLEDLARTGADTLLVVELRKLEQRSPEGASELALEGWGQLLTVPGGEVMWRDRIRSAQPLPAGWNEQGALRSLLEQLSDGLAAEVGGALGGQAGGELARPDPLARAVPKRSDGPAPDRAERVLPFAWERPDAGVVDGGAPDAGMPKVDGGDDLFPLPLPRR